jgi:hypothetical protein
MAEKPSRSSYLIGGHGEAHGGGNEAPVWGEWGVRECRAKATFLAYIYTLSLRFDGDGHGSGTVTGASADADERRAGVGALHAITTDN